MFCFGIEHYGKEIEHYRKKEGIMVGICMSVGMHGYGYEHLRGGLVGYRNWDLGAFNIYIKRGNFRRMGEHILGNSG